MDLENDTNKDRANTGDGTPGNKSQMVEKRSIIGKTAELIKAELFSDGTSEAQVRLEDFQFKHHIRKTSVGKIYLAKLPETGLFYDVLSMRKDKLIERGFI